jgi:hypothetical protein
MRESPRSGAAACTADSPVVLYGVVTGMPLLLVGLIAVVGAAVALAALLRRSGVAGAALPAGVLAGLLLGPGVAGRLAPELWTATFEGPPEQLQAVIHAARERDALLFATSASGATETGPPDALEALEKRWAEADAAWARARSVHRSPIAIAFLLLAGMVFLASGGATAVRAPIRRHQRTEAIVHALWWSAAGIGGAALLLWINGDALLTPGSFLICAASCCGPWCIGREDRRIAREVANEGAPLLEHSGRIASTAAIALATIAILLWNGNSAVVGCLIALACLPIGWIFPLRLATIADRFALPALTGLVFLSIEPFQDLSILLALGMYIVLEDARWFGGWIGLLVSDRAGTTGAARATLAALTVEPLIVAFVALGTASTAIRPELAGAALVGATGIAVLTKARRRAAIRLGQPAPDSYP